MSKMPKRKVLILGLDSAPADLMFGGFLDHLPNIQQLVQKGVHGVLQSCDPPITIPAWMVMMTGKSPGRLGLYGFRHRRGYSYTDISLSTSMSVKEPTLWDILAAYKMRSCVVAVPPSYPPKPLDGWLVSCFMMPSTQGRFTYPDSLKNEIQKLVGEYIPDVEFRVKNRDMLLDQLYTMTDRRFRIIEHLLKNKAWDFSIAHEIGPDRVHHAFWKYFDREHHLYQQGNPYENVVLDYYKFLDTRIGRLLRLLDDDTAVMVVSDHGVKRMKGAFCVNHWLAQEGYLVFEETPTSPMPLEKAKVDWARTRAWAWGGYYARIFLNVRGRESSGVIDPADYELMRSELNERLTAVRGPNGESWSTHVYSPEELYDKCTGDHADLMVYFDDLFWRAAGTVGHPTIYLSENDTGPDDSVHSKEGMFIIADGDVSYSESLTATLYDIAPTVLTLMGIPIPSDMHGRPIDPLGSRWG